MPDKHIQENEAGENENSSPDDTLPEFEFSNDEDDVISENDQDDSPLHFDSSGNLVIRNPSAYWIPEFEITEVFHGTIYTCLHTLS